MASLVLLISLLLVGLSICAEIPCPKGGCSNFTLYLGPKWGSKVIVVRGHDEISGASDEEPTDSVQVVLEEDAVDHDRRNPAPHTRPLLPDSSEVVDFSDTDNNVPQLPLRFDLVVLDYNGKNMTGDDVKTALASLGGDVTRQVRHLYLSHNNIRYLPVLTFPVEMEYELEELRLDNNPLSYLSSYTHFELSRLGNLRILSLARTGMFYLYAPYIPSLNDLDLSDNQLSSVPARLGELHDLQFLNLSGNHITSLSSFPQGAPLHVIDLSSNGMIYLSRDTFMSFYQLRALYLSNNSLQLAIQVDAPYDTNLYLGGNPWKCDCNLVALMEKSSFQIADRDYLTCVERDGQDPRLVSTVTPSYFSSLGCRGWRTVFKRVAETCQSLGNTVHRYFPRLSTIFTFLGCVFFSILIVRALRSHRRKTAPLEVPYNILDDKQVV